MFEELCDEAGKVVVYQVRNIEEVDLQSLRSQVSSKVLACHHA